GAAERGRGVAAAVAAGAAAAELVHERLGLAEELLGLLAGVGHDGVGALARRARGGLREEVLDHARDLAGPAVEEVGEALAHLPPLVGREEEAEGEAGGSADGEAPQGSPNGAAVLTHGRRGWVKGAAREDTPRRTAGCRPRRTASAAGPAAAEHEKLRPPSGRSFQRPAGRSCRAGQPGDGRGTD